MFVHFRRIVAFGLLAGGALLLPSSCASNDSSIFIRGCLATTDRTACMFDVEVTSAEVYIGSIDAAYAGEYHCIAAVENQMVSVGDPTTLQTETDGVELYDAEVQVLDPAQNNAALKQFSVPISGYIDPATSGTPGISGTDITLIDAATIQAEAQKVISSQKVQTVVASVIARGRTLGGVEVHTQEFLFPVDIYYGSTCFASAGAACCGGTTTTSTVDCRLAIDESTSCSTVCAYLGACHYLECPIDPATGLSVLTEAHCPAHTPPDDSCCNQ
jgi:hypothetical protein